MSLCQVYILWELFAYMQALHLAEMMESEGYLWALECWLDKAYMQRVVTGRTEGASTSPVHVRGTVCILMKS